MDIVASAESLDTQDSAGCQAIVDLVASQVTVVFVGCQDTLATLAYQDTRATREVAYQDIRDSVDLA